MKTVLSVDFSIIMAANLSFIGQFTQEFASLENQLDNAPILNFLNIDTNIYKVLTKMLYNQWTLDKDPSKTHFILGQEDTVHFLKQIKEEEEECTLINIDFHPDLQPYEDILNNTNWVRYAIDNDLIKNYIWIKDQDSPLAIPEGYDIDTSLTVQNVIFELLPKADEIVLSISKEWILPKDEHLFYLWEFLFRSVTGAKEIQYEEYQTDRNVAQPKE